MRSGVFISAVSHIALVALALFGTPKLFDNPQLAAIEVDLVRPEEVERPKEKEKPPEDKPAEWNPLPQQSPPQPEKAPQAQPKSPTPPQANQQAALGPQGASPSPQKSPWIFDPVNIPALLDLPNAPDKGFDSEATTTANLSAADKAAFRAQLKKCWTLPDGMSPAQSTRVVLRIYLRRDGRLAAEPVLIEASASRDGPLLMQAAIRTLKDCQPYGFLPADKYREWRVLDLSFSPREMAGG
jgi:outer membrane biosynthesis protein TonB